jgi:hypothetical protein
MIATILVSSPTFHAVEYNQQKVSQGKAELLEMTNFDMLTLGNDDPAKYLRRYLMAYSSRNQHIRNAQFHVAISCKGNEYSFPELVEIAHEYLRKMGYDNEGQPLLIYGHHDTDNNHIHIITSRVAPDGHKIDHNHERRRSLHIINAIINQREGLNVSADVAEALTYHFESVGQFKAILESEGYECYEDNDMLKVKKGGSVIDEVKFDVIEGKKSAADKETARRKRIRAFLLKYRDHCADKDELTAQMHRYFGISLVFVGRTDSPYGYFIVDHKEKTVYKGSSVLSLKQLLQFRSAEERFADIDSMVKSLIEAHPGLTTKELNKTLHRQFGTKLTKNGIQWGKETHQLADEIMVQLEHNDKLAWLQSFGPSSETECSILLHFMKMEDFKELKPTTKNTTKLNKAVKRVKTLMENCQDAELKDKFFEAGMRIYRQNGNYYCLDIQDRCIFNMSEQKLDVERLNRIYNNVVTSRTPQETKRQSTLGNNVKRTLTQQGGAGDENREYEVGSNEGYEESIRSESRMTM